MLVLGATAAWATPVVPTINISDLTEAAPTVTSSGFPSVPIIGNPVVVTLNEFANVTALLKDDFLTAGLYGAVMLENLTDPDYAASSYRGISDFATLAVSPKIPIVNTQAINLTFLSDGAVGFHTAVDAYLLGVGTGTIHQVFAQFENGDFQLLFNYDGLKVYAQSDAPAVPIPASALLFGTGLLGLVPAWRLRRQA